MSLRPVVTLVRAASGAAAAVALLLAAGCAGAVGVTLPQGPWTPDPSGAAALDSATGSCRGVRTLTAEIAVRGRVGTQRLRGRVLAGFERGGALRLEAPAPFGPPLFILTARAERGTLLLPRDRRVVIDAPVADILDAIVGLRRSADELLALVSGCATAGPIAASGPTGNGRGTVMAELGDGTTVFLKRDGGTWRLVAGRRDASPPAAAWRVAYERFLSPFPDMVRVTMGSPTGDGGGETTLSFEISQRETNTTIDPRAFEPAGAADAVPMSLDDLRRSGPLADRTGGTGNHP